MQAESQACKRQARGGAPGKSEAPREVGGCDGAHARQTGQPQGQHPDQYSPWYPGELKAPTPALQHKGGVLKRALRC